MGSPVGKENHREKALYSNLFQTCNNRLDTKNENDHLISIKLKKLALHRAILFKIY